MLQAEVALGVRSIETPLSYAIPVALAAAVQVGVRVVVPLGARRQVVGVVVALKAADAAATKPIARVLDAAPVVSTAQLALVDFVRRYYCCDLGAALALVLPPDTDSVLNRRFRLTDAGERARVFFGALQLSKRDVALLQTFEAGLILDEKAIARGDRQRQLYSLIDRGLVEVVDGKAPVGRLQEVEAIEAIDGAPLPQQQKALAALDAWLRAFAKKEGRWPLLTEAKVAHADAVAKLKRLETLGRIQRHLTLKPQARERVESSTKVVALTPAQQTAAQAITDAMAQHSTSAFLLHGVTGSGKTEVYLAAISATLRAGHSALIMVPEIGLTPQLVDRVQAGLCDSGIGPDDIVVLHSAKSPAERATAWSRLRQGEARVVVGARSAIFAPMPKLGLIVVDEEHDQSFKQDETPRYHARDVALWRAKNEGAVCVLGSATPSLESVLNARQNKLTLLTLPTRVGASGQMPTIQLIDLRTRKNTPLLRQRDTQNADALPGVVLSQPLVHAIEETLALGEQTILFLNKRGYSSALLCEACGLIHKCAQCTVSMTFHRNKNAMICHQCGTREPVPAACPVCGTPGMMLLGTGTERIEHELAARFPTARVARLDRDSTERKGTLEATLRAIHGREVDIIVGTQMIAKGHDFPHVRTVGIVFADHALALPDFRASERAFSLLLQVAGRAGRGEKRGQVLVQTHDPTHPVLTALASGDVDNFVEQELSLRAQLLYPPYSRALLVRVECEDANDARLLAERVADVCKRKATPSARVLGPAPCAIERIKGRTRMQVFVRDGAAATRHAIAHEVQADATLAAEVRKRNARLIIDVDPVHLL